MLCQTGVLRWSKDSQPFIVRPLVIRVAVCSHSAPRIHLRLGSCASSCADADVLSASDREAAVLPAGVEDPLRRPDPILPHRRLPSRCTSRLRLNVYLSRRRWAWWTQAGQEDLITDQSRRSASSLSKLSHGRRPLSLARVQRGSPPLGDRRVTEGISFQRIAALILAAAFLSHRRCGSGGSQL